MKKIIFSILFVLTLFTFAKETSRQPNIVVITIDSLGSKHMGIYGYNRDTTPFLDSFFKSGALFENAISTSHLTFPSFNSMLTSLYPSQINSRSQTLSKTLEKNGYLIQEVTTYDRKKDLISQIPGKKSSKPLFLLLNIRETEMPYEAPSKEFYLGKYDGPFSDMSLSKWNWNLINGNGVKAADGKYRQKFSKEDEIYFTAAYDSQIRSIDQKLEQFFKDLSHSSYNLTIKNSIFIVTSGHGNSISEHQFPFHQDLYDTNLHIPLAIVGKGIKAKVAGQQVSLTDIMPTILRLLNIDPPIKFEGENLFEVKNDRFLFSERVQLDEYSVRTDKYKFILRNPRKKGLKFDPKREYADYLQSVVEGDLDKGDELYDLSKDKNEQINLVGKNLPVEHDLRQKTEEFRNRMLKWRNQNAK